jgi:arylsulfatase A-like enzyme
LLVAGPGQRIRQDVSAPTSAVDLLPTLCRIAGDAVPAWCEGQLLPGLFSDDMVSERSVYAVEAKQSPKNGALSKATYALIDSRYKLIRYTGYPELPEAYELYDLIEDPEELNDLYTPSNPVAVALKEELTSMLARAGAG